MVGDVIEEWYWAVTTSVLVTICFTITVVACLCGCKTSEPKDELRGVEGHVKITSLEDDVEELSINNIQEYADHEHNTRVQDNRKTITTANRSLPDLPIDKNTAVGDVHWEPNGDANSELYATVGIQEEKNKTKGKSNAREHPYDKLKKVEHPYAQVRHSRNAIDLNEPSTSTDRRTVSDVVSDVESPNTEPVSNIHAAIAIAGRVSASEELPYMTPPTHFSGDSQDSGKGYTSISVREPLSTIIAETKSTETSRRAEISSSHYTTVSDDSDEMYAAIDEPLQVYTSGSETYVQIQQNTLAPQPPSVDSLKHINDTHRRQASSSSASSSVALGSPKPEKRPANSPLPPPPKHNSSEDERGRNVEDMYAKVNKKRLKEDVSHERTSTESCISESSDSVSYKLHVNHNTDTSKSSNSYPSKNTNSPITPKTNSVSRSSSNSTNSDSETSPHDPYHRLEYEQDVYEEKGPPSDQDPNYEQLRPQEHEYASIVRKKQNELVRTDSDGYARVERSESDVNDGYARVQRAQVSTDGYATVRPGGGYETMSSDGYETVKRANSEEIKADGYTRVPQDESYEQVDFGDVQSDSRTINAPTYESLGHEFDDPDPNYESVEFTKSIEPPYQMLREFESGSSGTS